MITTQWILDTAVNSIKAIYPEAIYEGSIETIESIFDPATNKTTENVTSETIEVILETLTQEEIQASGLLADTVRLYVIGDKVLDINFYQRVVFNGATYRISKLVDSLVGQKTALWTITAIK